MAPLAVPSAPEAAKAAPMLQPSTACKQQEDSSASQLKGSSSRQVVSHGMPQQESTAQPDSSSGSKKQETSAPRHQSRQQAVVYSLGESSGICSRAVAPPSSTGEKGKPAVYHPSGSPSDSESPSGSPGHLGGGAVASASQLKPKAGLSIAQQAVLRCRQKQLAVGEPEEELQRRRGQLEDVSLASASKQAGMSPSQANAMARGRMMHAHLAPPQSGLHDSAMSNDKKSGKDTGDLPPSQKLRRDSETGQRPLPAGAKRGAQALGSPHGSAATDAFKACQPGSSSSGMSPESFGHPLRQQEQAQAARSSPQALDRHSLGQQAALIPQHLTGTPGLPSQQHITSAFMQSPAKPLQSKPASPAVAQVRS